MWANLPPYCSPRLGAAEANASRPMTRHPPHDELLESAPVSADAITPRGGFMARPGLKSPPRHAVVVRGGDAPESEHIPVLRSSAPPPPPASGPAQPTTDEKVTLRAIPTPSAPRVNVAPSSSPPAVSESLPPPSYVPFSRAPLSDAPVVTSPLDASDAPSSQRASGSRWAIVAAAAAGLILGLASVAAKVAGPTVAAQPPQGATLPATPAAPPASVAAPAEAGSAAQPSKAAPSPTAGREHAEPKLAHPPAPTVKRSIF